MPTNNLPDNLGKTEICNASHSVLVIADLAKVVTAGNIDDKMKKEVSQKVLTRVIYSVLIFLVPTIVGLFFNIVPIDAPGMAGQDATWKTCWDAAKP